MIDVRFTSNLQRHVDCPDVQASGGTVREVLASVFAENQTLGTYVLDEQGALRSHMVVFVNGRAVTDRVLLSDPVPDQAEVYVMQALSGG
ncbi:MAG: MoaD/ThiS family protein [Phycisphaerae bacterium]